MGYLNLPVEALGVCPDGGIYAYFLRIVKILNTAMNDRRLLLYKLPIFVQH